MCANIGDHVGVTNSSVEAGAAGGSKIYFPYGLCSQEKASRDYKVTRIWIEGFRLDYPGVSVV